MKKDKPTRQKPIEPKFKVFGYLNIYEDRNVFFHSTKSNAKEYLDVYRGGRTVCVYVKVQP